MKFVPKILCCLALVWSSIALAGPNGPPPPGIPPPGLPIDDGVMLLLAAALALGIYKTHQFRNYKKNPV